MNRFFGTICFFISIVVCSLCLAACNNNDEKSSESESSSTISESQIESTESSSAIKKYYDVNYYLNENTLISSDEIEEGQTLSLPEDPVMEDFTFIAWFIDKEFNTYFDATQKIYEDINLYAMFKRNVKITFESEHDLADFGKEFIAYEGMNFKLPKNSDFNQTNKYLESILIENVSYQPGDEIIVTKNISVKLVFKELESISFDLGDIETSVSVPETIYAMNGQKITLPALVINTINLYGWTDGKDVYLPGENFVISKSTTLTAIWARETTINYLDEGQKIGTVVLNSNDGYVLELREKINKEGATFIGWNYQGKTYQPGEEIIITTQNANIVAVFIKMTYYVSFVDWDGTIVEKQEVEYGSAAVAPENDIFKVDEFKGWNKSFERITENLIVRAVYNYTPSEKSNFIFNLIDGVYYIGASSNKISGDISFPHSYNGKLVVGTTNSDSYLKAPFYACKNMTSVYIPSSFTNIYQFSFKGCSALKSVVIHENAKIESYDKDSFMECTSLENLTFVKTLKILGERCLYGSSLKEISITKDIEVIGYNAFFGCLALENIFVDSDNMNYQSIDGNLYSKDGSVIIRYCAAKTSDTFVLNKDIIRIEDFAFNRVVSLKNFSFEENSKLQSIGDYAFGSSINIEELLIPASVKEFGASVFYECKAKIVLEEGLEVLGDAVFKYYKGDSFTIPASVTTLGDNLFSNCDISELNFEEGSKLKVIGNYCFEACRYLKTLNFQDLAYLEKIGAFAFALSPIEEVIFPSSLTEIGESAFEKSKVKNVSFLPNSSIKVIDDSAFFTCTSLESFVIESVNSQNQSTIGNYVFCENVSLVKVVLPNNLISIGGLAFGSYAGYEIPISNIVLPSTVEVIMPSAFNGCTKMKTFDMTNSSLRILGSYAFKLCSSLETLTLPKTIESIGVGIVQYCTSLKSLNIVENDFYQSSRNGIYEKKTTTLITGFSDENGVVEVLEGTTKIAADAFKYDSTIKKLIICDSLEEIGKTAFKECTNLTDIIIGENSQLKIIRESAFSANELENAEPMKIKSMYFPSKLEYIEFSAFYCNSAMVFNELPASLREIGGYAFYGCQQIESLLIKEGSKLEKIGALSFSRCSNLESVEINAQNLKSIMSSAFSKCGKLSYFKIYSSSTTLGKNVFLDSNSNLKIYVPASSLGYYKTAENWSEYASKINGFEDQSMEGSL